LLSKEFFDFIDDFIVDQTKEDGHNNTLQQMQTKWSEIPSG
jgi:hypothetical protein